MSMRTKCGQQDDEAPYEEILNKKMEKKLIFLDEKLIAKKPSELYIVTIENDSNFPKNSYFGPSASKMRW